MWDWCVYAICQGQEVRVVRVEDGAVAGGERDQVDKVKGIDVDPNNK